MYRVKKEEEHKYQFPNKEFYEIDRSDYSHLERRFQEEYIGVHAVGDLEREAEFFAVDKRDGTIYASINITSLPVKCYLYNVPSDDILKPNKPVLAITTRETLDKFLNYLKQKQKE